MDAREAIFADCRRSVEATGIERLRPLAGSRIVVTGGTGFVGCWLLSLLAYLNDHHDFGVAATFLARRPQRLAATAPFLAGRADLTPVAGDVRQISDIPADTDWVIHLAGVPDGRHHASDPIGTASVIAEGTLRVLRTAEPVQSLRGVLHFSSGLVQAPAPGGHSRVDATSVYADAKRFSEAACAAFRTQARLPIVVTRPFTFLGPFQPLDAPWAANNFLHSALNGLPLKIMGSGDAPRAFLYGSDMAVLALCQLVGGENGAVYDLGGPEAIPVIELARAVVAHAGRPLEIRTNTASRAHPTAVLVPDVGHSVERFGFRPAFSVPEAIGRTLAWHSRRPQAGG